MGLKSQKASLVAVLIVSSVVAGVAHAAEPTISVTAKQRYPWNGMVDVAFTITGDVGQKYATSIKALDVVGNETLPITSVYDLDGNQVSTSGTYSPGSYHWVWDAMSDVSGGLIKNPNCLSTVQSVVFTNLQLSSVTEFSAIHCGKAISDKTRRTLGTWIKTDGEGKEVQFATADDKYTKCVCVHFEQQNSDVVAYIKWARYVSGTASASDDFNSNSATTMAIATSESDAGYGLRSVAVKTGASNSSFCCDRVSVVGSVDPQWNLYMVVDLSAGPSASNYPVSFLSSVPSGGWTDTYKTTKLVLRRCSAGSFKMQGTTTTKLSKDFYIGIFEVSQKQYSLIIGTNPSTAEGVGNTYPVHYVSYNMIRGSSSGAEWPNSSSVDASSFMGKLRSRSGFCFDLPTEAQWEYACRAGTTTAYCCGNSVNGDYMWYGGNSSSSSQKIGTKKANAWGIYDMHGNVWEWCLDWRGTLSYGTDPKGPTTGTQRVRRGGSYPNETLELLSSSYHGGADPSNKLNVHGFRLCFTMP